MIITKFNKETNGMIDAVCFEIRHISDSYSIMPIMAVINSIIST